MIAKVPVISVTGGISQQAAGTARPDKVQDSLNFLPYPEVGATHRAGSRHLARAYPAGAPDHVLLPLDIGGNEKYVAALSNEHLQVFLSNGESVPIWAVTRDAEGAITGGTAPDFSYLDLRARNLLAQATQPVDPDVEGFSNWITSGTAQATTPGDSLVPSPLNWQDVTGSPEVSAFTLLQDDGTGAEGIWEAADFNGWSERRLRFSLYVTTDVGALDNVDRVGLNVFFNGSGGFGGGQMLVYWDFGGSYDAVPTPVWASSGEFAGETMPLSAERLGPNLFRLSLLFDPDLLTGAHPEEDPGQLWGVSVHIDQGSGTGTSAVGAWGALLEDGVESGEPAPGDYAVPASSLRRVSAVATTFVANPNVPTREGSGASTTFADVYGTHDFNRVGGGAALTDDVNDAAYIWVRQSSAGGPGTHYTIELGTTAGDVTLTGSVTTAANTGISALAAALAADINALAANTDGGAPAFLLVEAVQNQDVIQLLAQTDAGVTIKSITFSSGVVGGSTVGIIDEVDTIGDLPLTWQDDARVWIVDPTEADFDQAAALVPLRFRSKDAGEFASGVWEEGTEYGVTVDLDASTLPHVLVRRVDDAAGTVTGVAHLLYFEWGEHTWEERLVGDDTTNRLPSFVTPPDEEDVADRYVRAVGFFQGRLVLAGSAQDLALSETSRYGNFWRTTVQAIPDNDRIDFGVAPPRGTTISDVVVATNFLYLLAGTAALRLVHGEYLTPTSVGIDVDLVAPVSPTPQSAAGGPGFLFASDGSDFSGAYFVAPTPTGRLAVLAEAAEVSHLLPTDVDRIDWSTYANFFLLGSPSDRTSLFGLRVRQGEEGLSQAAWFRVGADGSEVLSFCCLGADVFWVVDRDGSPELERWTTEFDPRYPGESWDPRLDRRVVTDGNLRSSYSAPNTTFTLPWDVEDGATVAVVRLDQFGVALEVVSASGDEVVVTGDHTGTPVAIGQTFTAELEPKYPVLQLQSPGGGWFPVVSARQVIRRVTAAFSRSGAGTVRVTAIDGTPYDSAFDGEGATSVAIEDREVRAGVLALPPDVDVAVRNSTHKPCTLAGLEWEMQLVDRGSRSV